MTKKEFFLKLKNFIKRNLPAMAVSFCMIFALSLVTAVAVTRMQVKENLSSNTIPDNIEENEQPVNASEPIVFALPVEGAVEGLPFAQDYLVKYPTLDCWQTHEAVDFIAIAGTKVVCAYDGTVESIETDAQFGTVIVIDHGKGLKTIYKSLSTDVTVKSGDKVVKGQQIGMVSNSAKFEQDQGAHLHFEVMLDDQFKNPYDYLPSSNK